MEMCYTVSMNVFNRPFHIPLIEALPGHLFPNAAPKLGQLSLLDTEPTAKILKFPMAQVVELHTPDNIQLGAE